MEESKTDCLNAPPVSPVRSPKVIAITSGKGGVGKTNVVGNLAISLSRMGKRVLVLDADLGLGNMDIIFGLMPKFTLEHVLLGQKKLSEVIVQGPGGIRILPAGSGREHLTQLGPEQKLILQAELDRLEESVDIFLIDTAAGISSNVLYFNVVAQEIIVVASPEPASITDAYAVMKVLTKRYSEKRFHLLVNQVHDEGEARDVHRKLSVAAGQFLNVAIDYAGFIPMDDYLKMAVCGQRAVVEVYPNARSSQGFLRLAKKILQWPDCTVLKGSVQFLWKRMLSMDAETPPAMPLEEGNNHGGVSEQNGIQAG